MLSDNPLFDNIVKDFEKYTKYYISPLSQAINKKIIISIAVDSNLPAKLTSSINIIEIKISKIFLMGIFDYIYDNMDNILKNLENDTEINFNINELKYIICLFSFFTVVSHEVGHIAQRDLSIENENENIAKCLEYDADRYGILFITYFYKVLKFYDKEVHYKIVLFSILFASCYSFINREENACYPPASLRIILLGEIFMITKDYTKEKMNEFNDRYQCINVEFNNLEEINNILKTITYNIYFDEKIIPKELKARQDELFFLKECEKITSEYHKKVFTKNDTN